MFDKGSTMKWIAPLPVLGALVAACGLNASGVDPTGGVSSTSAQGPGGGATGGAGGAGSSSAEASASSGAGGDGGGTGVGGGGGGGDPTWARRRQLTIELGVNATVSEFPVLVVLKPERIDYGSTKPAGEDLRFTSDDGGEVLAHEIEHWEAGQTSFVWVKLPEITQTGANKTKFWMYYGSSSAADGQDVAAVWTSFRGVWHLHETGDDLKDSSGNTAAATNYGTTQVSAKIGMGRSFSSTMKSYVDTHHVEDLTQFTIEGWLYAEFDAGTGTGWGPNGLLMREKNYQINWDHPQNEFYAAASLYEDSSNTWVAALYPKPVKHTWYYLAATLDDSDLKAYMDGEPFGEVSTGAPAPETESAKIGRHAFAQELKHFFTGIIDEVRIADAPRDAQWIASQYKSMTDANFVTFGMEQMGEYSIP